MPTQDVLISQKFNNYNYAPGIATYGVDGKTGITGNDGNNIYFTDCDLINDNDNKNLNALGELLRGNYLPVKGSTTIIARSYKNDDLFFDQNGIIYKLKDIDSLLGSSGKDVYGKYFSIAGKISIADYDGYFNKENNRLILNSSDFSGFDVITSPNLSTNIDSNAVVNIISNNIDENDNIELVKMQSIDNVDIEDGNLDVYYKTTDNAYYLESNMPIVINSNVKINDDANNIDYDNYSSVLTSIDPVTYFKHVCDNLRYNILYDADANQYKIIIFQNDNGRDLLDYIVSRKETVFGKIYSDESGQTLVKLNDVVNGPVNDSNKLEHYVATKSINITVNTNNFTIMHDGITYNIPNTSIHINDLNTSLNDLNNSKRIEISLDPIYVKENNTPVNYSKEFNSKMFTVTACQDGEVTIYKSSTEKIKQKTSIKQQTYKNINSICKFTFNTNDFNTERIIKLNLKPALEDLSGWPVVLIINIPVDVYGQNSLYFELKYSVDKFIIDNILISSDNNLITNGKIAQGYQIETYIPENLDSIDRVALLHNTEVFINYQNYRNDVEQKLEETDYYSKLK